MQVKKDDILQNFLYGLLLLAFLLLYFLLSINNRPAADDFYFLNNLDTYGWWDSVLVSWETWVTRWASVLLLNFIFGLYGLTGNFLFFHIITLLTLCFALYRFTTALAAFLLKRVEAPDESMIRFAGLPRYSRFTVLAVISFFFLIPGTGESFFWITSTSMYLWSFIAMCFLLAELSDARPTIQTFLVALIASAFIGGAAEAIALMVVFILVAFIIFQVRTSAPLWPSLLSLAVLMTSLLISYSGEGRVQRLAALPDPDVLQSLRFSAKSLFDLEVHFFVTQFPWVILFFLAWGGFALMIPGRVSIRIPVFLLIVLICLLSSFVFFIPVSLLLGDIVPDRAKVFVSFMNCLGLAFAGIAAGHFIRNRIVLKITSSLALLALVFLIMKTAFNQKIVAGNYARAVDSRMQFLTTLVDPEDSSVIILEKLPDPGMLTTSEISEDPGDFRNQHLKNYLGIRGRLRVK